MKFDLAEVDTKTLSDAGVEMTVHKLNPKEPLIARNGQPVTITVLGPDSAVYRECTRKAVQRRLQRAAAKQQFGDESFDEVENDSLDMLAAVTVGWKNVFDTEGNPIPFTKEIARALYAAYPVVREQVDAFVADRARFLKAPSQS